MTKRITWNEENTLRLQELVGANDGTEILRGTVENVADNFGTSTRSIGNKLRNLGYAVQKAADKVSAWGEAQEAKLKEVLTANEGVYTYAELENVLDMGFSAKQIQGKVLAMELYGNVRKAEKVQAKREYTEQEDARFVEMCNSGATIEQLVAEFGKSCASIRGKSLSLLRTEAISAMPKQEHSNAKVQKDALDGIDNLAELTVAEIAEHAGKSERGIKSMLSHRGLIAKDYDGAAKRAKLDASKD
jgi:hypothetical protein